MLRKTLLIVSTSALLGAAVIAPNAALAQLPPLPAALLPVSPAAPPGLPGVVCLGSRRSSGPGAAGLPRPPGVGGGRPGLHGGQGNVYGRSGTYAYGHTGVYGHTGNYGYGRSGYAYGYGSWRDRYWAPYGVSVYSNSNSSGCYYTYKYSYRLGAYRRVQVCSEE